MPAVFLSYSREDRAFAESLTRLLEQAGHDVWWDRDIDSGSEFSGEIEAALERADIVLVAWSLAAAKSAWVRDEAAIGRDTGRLVPVVIDGSQPPIGFRQFQALDLTGWKGAKKDPRTLALLRTIDRRAQSLGKGSPKIVPTPQRPTTAWQRRRMWVIFAALIALVAVAGTSFLVLKSRQDKGDRRTKPTIALVSFAAPSSDAQLRDLSGQVRDSLSHALSQTGVPVRLLDSMPPSGSAAGDFVISGELTRSAEKAVASVRLIEATQGVTVFSTRFEAAPDEVRDFPERIGAQLASMLSNGAILLTLDRHHPLDPAVMTELLSGEGASDPLQTYQMNKRVAAKSPNVPSAQVGVAFFTGFVLDQLPRSERPQAVAEGRRAYERALELAPDFGDTYAAWCLLHDDSHTIECEDNLRKGSRVDPDAPYLNTFLGGVLVGVGRFDEALDLARLSYSHDPYDPPKIRDMLRMLEASGNKDEARELYQDGARWWPERKRIFFRNRIYGLVDRGDFEGVRQLEQEVDVAKLAPQYPPSTAIAAAIRSKSVPALRAACPGGDNIDLMVRCMIAFSTLGDLDSAFAIADKLYPTRIGRTPVETEKIWLDDPSGGGPLGFITSRASAAMRRDPRYLRIAQRTGLLNYWRSGRLPDFCRKNPEPICGQLHLRH
jgi:TolB-like protein/tetratricopeptide (TPR) repeat protein